jgi:hypothetical protein
MVSNWSCGKAEMQVIDYSSNYVKEMKCKDFNLGLCGSG